MKQCITLEQMSEISTEFIVPIIKGGFIKCPVDKLIKRKSVSDQFTIGKMIEVLSAYDEISIDKQEEYWAVFAKSVVLYELELCDALWEAVKEILKEGD